MPIHISQLSLKHLLLHEEYQVSIVALSKVIESYLRQQWQENQWSLDVFTFVQYTVPLTYAHKGKLYARGTVMFWLTQILIILIYI
jgi:hypothetical protein